MPPKHRSKSTAPRGGTQPSHGPASPSEQAPSTLSTDELSMALIEALSSEDVINKLNRDSINYARITNEVTKRIKLIVDPLLTKLKEKTWKSKTLKPNAMNWMIVAMISNNTAEKVHFVSVEFQRRGMRMSLALFWT